MSLQEDECMVLDGAIILDGAVVHKHAVVAPGAVVGSGKQVLSGQIWAGVPAEYLRDVSETEMAYITSQAAETITLALAHAEENSKPWQQIEAEQVHDPEASFCMTVKVSTLLRNRTRIVSDAAPITFNRCRKASSNIGQR
jgi:hypothetical protein